MRVLDELITDQTPPHLAGKDGMIEQVGGELVIGSQNPTGYGLLKRPRGTFIGGYWARVYFPQLGDSFVVATNDLELSRENEERLQLAKRFVRDEIIKHLKHDPESYAQPRGFLHLPWVAKSADTQLLCSIARLYLKPKYGTTVEKVISPATYGIIPGTAFSIGLEKPFVAARKEERPPSTWQSGYIVTKNPVPSATIPGQLCHFKIPKDEIRPGMKVLLVDDFLRYGRTEIEIAKALTEHGVEVAGIVNVTEKEYDKGRVNIKRELGIDAQAVVKVEAIDELKEEGKVCILISELLFEPTSLTVDLPLRSGEG